MDTTLNLVFASGGHDLNLGFASGGRDKPFEIWFQNILLQLIFNDDFWILYFNGKIKFRLYLFWFCIMYMTVWLPRRTSASVCDVFYKCPRIRSRTRLLRVNHDLLCGRKCRNQSDFLDTSSLDGLSSDVGVKSMNLSLPFAVSWSNWQGSSKAMRQV